MPRDRIVRLLTLVLVLCTLLLSLPGCRTYDDGSGPGEGTWTSSERSPLLSDAVRLRAHYYPMISPTIYDWYAFAGGRKITTLDELRKHVVAIDTEEKAIAYRELLARVHLDAEDDIFPIVHGTPLVYRAERKGFGPEYSDAEVAHWGVGTRRKVTSRGDAWEIVEVQHRYIPDRSPPEPNIVKVGTEAIELVMETITKDGRYKRTVLRTLEHGAGARNYAPMPLL